METAKMTCLPRDWCYFSKRPPNKIRLELPLAALHEPSHSQKLMELKPDGIIRGVSFDEDLGTISFDVDEKKFISKTLLEEPECYEDASQMPGNLVVEFSSPNVAKPFHVGHLRSTIVGQFVAKILNLSNKVNTVNYLGDWGTQFGYVLNGLRLIDSKSDDFRKNPLKTLNEAYVKAYNTPGGLDEARKLFAKMEQTDDPCLNEWETIKNVTVKSLKETYNLFGIEFNEYSCESNYRMSNIQPVIKELLERNLAQLANDQLVIDIEGKAVPLLRQNNTSLYLMRDVAAALDRIKRYNCDRLIYVVDKSQNEHFKNLDHILTSVGHPGVVQYVPFGRVTGMSTRKGTAVFLSDVLEESFIKMAEQQKKSKNTKVTDEETTRVLGLTGLQVYILKHGRMRDVTFNWDQALQGSGDSGVKIQYTHSRLSSLEERFDFDISCQDLDVSSLYNEPTALPLVYELARCDDVISNAAKQMESSLLVSHLFKLCNLTSRALKELKIRDQEQNVALQRLLLFVKARKTIKRNMELLGLKPLTKM